MFKKVSVLVLVSAMVFGDMAPAFAKPKKSAKKQRAASVKKNVKKGKVEVETTATVEKVEESVPDVEPSPTQAPEPAPIEAKAEPVILQPIINVNPVIDVPANIAPSANVLAEQKRAKETFAKVKSDLQAKLSNAQSSCSGIKSNLDSIFGLSVATTVSSSLGTLAAGSALAVGIMKSKTDKKYEENNELLTLWNKAITSGNVEDAKAFDEKIDEINRIISSGEQGKLEKKSKTLGNVRTGLMAGATATSAVSTGTSIGASLNAKKLAEKMEACNKAISELKTAISVAEAEEVDAEKLVKAREITSACTGFDKDNIDSLKRSMTASAIVSGIGTATAGTGTVTSALANSNKVRSDNSEKGRKKEKNLNLVSNIMAGVTAGTSGASTILSATAIKKAKQDSEMAEKCEAVLAQ